jgi:hypothetical protein
MKTAIWCYFRLSAGISSHGRYQPHGQWSHLEVDAAGRDRAYGWLSVGYHASGVLRPGRVGHSDPQRPSAGSIWRPISRTTGGVGVCPLDRAVGVNPGFSLRYGMRFVVLVPQHQTAIRGARAFFPWPTVRPASSQLVCVYIYGYPLTIDT